MDKQVIKARELESKLMYNSYYRIGDWLWFIIL
jgi:hypothetical protein